MKKALFSELRCTVGIHLPKFTAGAVFAYNPISLDTRSPSWLLPSLWATSACLVTTDTALERAGILLAIDRCTWSTIC